MDAKIAGALFFWGFAVMTVLPAMMLIVVRDVIRCAMLLLATLGGVAGLFVLLGADFLGLVQILVYIGGILILLMYGVMLTDRAPVLLQRQRERELVAPGILAALFLLAPSVYIAIAIAAPYRAHDGASGMTWPFPPAAELPEPTSSARRIGELLMTDYILPFEVISLLLLAALVGAAYIARMGGEGESDA
jgi:NADH-quinone oxidoreductase subunit J